MDLLRVEAGHQSTASGPAAGSVVELREAQAVLRERIEIRRLNLAAIATEVGVTEIIREDEDDVGLRGEQRRAERRENG